MQIDKSCLAPFPILWIPNVPQVLCGGQYAGLGVAACAGAAAVADTLGGLAHPQSARAEHEAHHSPVLGCLCCVAAHLPIL
jgi:hypothetical protein